MNTLTNLYGSSHSYLQNLCEGNACNQAPTTYLQELSAENNSLLYQADTVTLYQVGPKGCGQTVLQKNNAAPAMVFDPLLKEGTCASEGYTIPHGSVAHKVPIFDKFATIIIDEFVKPAALQELACLPSPDSFAPCVPGVQLYQIGPDGCGQVITTRANSFYSEKYDKSLKKGTCASQGYTRSLGNQIVNLPDVNNKFGHIKVAKYAKPFTLYQVGVDGCGQVQYSKENEKYILQYDSALKEGTCADNGYTLAAGSEIYKVPGASGAFSRYQINKFEKPQVFYQIGAKGCGQIETFEANVAPTLAYDKALKPGTCTSQGYTEFTGNTQVHAAGRHLGAFGIVNVAKYVAPTTFYQIGPEGCGQISTGSMVNTAPTLAYDSALKPGTCASQGYTKRDGKQNVTLPEKYLGSYGQIHVLKFTKPSLMELYGSSHSYML